MTERQYAAAGVDLSALDAAKRRIAGAVEATRTPLSRGLVGAFGGMVRLPEGIRRPVLVMSTDSVGTKVLVARMAGVYDGVGEDIVNHSVNDILVHGARGIAFQDYIGSNGLTEGQLADLVVGVARGCQRHGMALTGGETASLPDIYAPGDYDLAGTIVGVVEEDLALHGAAIRPGDVLIGYQSSGLHTNGYTLARKICFDRLKLAVDSTVSDLGTTVGEALLAVHRSYFTALDGVLDQVHGIAHITGGGIEGNLVRVLPPEVEAVIDTGSWRWPPLFTFLMSAGQVSVEEMRQVFNVGMGLVVAAPPGAVDRVRQAAAAVNIDTWIAGELRAGTRGVRFI
ncbi:MAG: phosphoribosylformylglycinamidine cyclo-ligase [Gemmatimonadetes bacterium]|nr:phosphoribosylformylglycinamidine cyclo-ligase [Gemmatimonadota bacterium]